MPKHAVCPPGQNNLLRTLPEADRAALEPHLTVVSLDQHKVLGSPDEPIGSVVFPMSGVGSIIARADGRRIEAGLFGREGLSHVAALLGTDRSPNETVMQVPGKGFSVPLATLHELMEDRTALREHLLRYAQAFATQTMFTALSNGQGKLEERLARWLLMCHDRVDGDTMELTHDYVAVMLGVRRAGVTVGTHILEGKGLIRASRGRITVADREGLEEEARDSYGAPEREYDRLFPAPEDG